MSAVVYLSVEAIPEACCGGQGHTCTSPHASAVHWYGDAVTPLKMLYWCFHKRHFTKNLTLCEEETDTRTYKKMKGGKEKNLTWIMLRVGNSI